MKHRYTIAVFFILAVLCAVGMLAGDEPLRAWEIVDKRDVTSEAIVIVLLASWVVLLHWIQASSPVFWLLYCGFSLMTFTAIENVIDEWLDDSAGILSQLLGNYAFPIGIFLVSIGLFRWAMEQHRSQQHFRALSESDPLTGLGNRASFDYQLKSFSSAEGNRALLMMDIDDFKAINDTFGHMTGDRVIQHLAGVTRSALREHDAAFRYGGEEFSVLLKDVPVDVVGSIAERIINNFSLARFDVEGHDSFLRTVSIGAAHVSGPVEPAEWLDRADKALYAAKRKGKNRAEVVVLANAKVPYAPTSTRATAE